MRKNEKIGAIFLIAIVALAGTGVAYSAWTDTLHIVGNVSTGSVEWHFSDYSGMWVYKDLAEESIEITVAPMDDPDGDRYIENDATHDGYDYYLVAWSYAKQGADDHNAIVDFGNIFPLDAETPNCFEADVEITYTGTIPAKINGIIFGDLLNGGAWPDTPEEVLIDQVTSLEITVNDVPVDQADLPGYQLHENDVIHIIMRICIPELDTYEGITGYFDVSVEVVQWNEYLYTPSV